MFPKTVRIVAAVTASLSLASAAVPAMSQADTAKSTAKAGQPTISPISVMKQTDIASVSLY